MRTVCIAVTTLAMACTSVDDLPPGPGGTGGTGTPAEGDRDDGDNGGDGSLVSGQVCRLVDLRDPVACEQLADMSGIVVELQTGAASTLTAVDGTFELDITPTDTIVLQAAFDAPGFEPTVVPLRIEDGFTDLIVPIVDSVEFAKLLAAIDVLPPQDTGNLAVYLSQNGSPLIDAVIDNVSAAFDPFYDTGSALDWRSGLTGPGRTGPAGAALVFGINQPVTDLTAIDSVGNGINFFNIPVGADAITFLSVAFD